jgi:hypothetical protein
MSFEQKDIKFVYSGSGEYEDNGKGDLIEKTSNITFAWGIDNFGFGETVFFYDDGVLKCDNETMSKESIKKILCEFVDRAEFID